MKKRIAAAGIAVFLAAVAAGFYFADTATVFKGTRTAEPDRFELVFTEMNKMDSDDMLLEAGDVLSVGFHIAKGKADLEIGLKGKEPVYRGNGTVSGSFEVTVPETGTYRVAVKARHAEGEISVIRTEKGTGEA